MGSEWNQCCLARLVRANVIACCLSASVVVGFDQDVRVVSCLVCQRQFSIEENARDMVALLRWSECAWLNSFVDWFLRVWLQCSLLSSFACEGDLLFQLNWGTRASP